MFLPTRYLTATLVGLVLPAVLLADTPTRLSLKQGKALDPQAKPANNQQTANTIAAQLRQSRQLVGFQINVMYQDGMAELSGVVANPMQRAEAIRIVKTVPGVKQVSDKMVVAQYSPIVQVQAAMPRPAAPAPGGNATTPYSQPVEPAGVFYSPPASPYAVNTPFMPPYAWPTYAPYNNFSRVAYPRSYPYNAFPFIGPFYPFPKVPLGWRKVQLEWMDGHWWMGKTAQKHDWWRIRYW